MEYSCRCRTASIRRCCKKESEPTVPSAWRLEWAAAKSLRDTYERSYYAGIICERRAKAHHERGGPGSGFVAYDLFRQAMDWYAKAETLRPPGNDDAVLRWNTCARILARHPDLRPAPQERVELPLE